MLDTYCIKRYLCKENGKRVPDVNGVVGILVYSTIKTNITLARKKAAYMLEDGYKK